MTADEVTQPANRHESSSAEDARDPASEPSSSGLATGSQPSLTREAPPPAVEPAPAMPVVPPEAIKEITEASTDAVVDAVTDTPEAVKETPPETAVPSSAASSEPAPSSPRQSLGPKMRAMRLERKHARLEKVMEIAREKRVITNNIIQLALGVSDATATNYLRELVQAGKLRRIGIRAGTKYEVI